MLGRLRDGHIDDVARSVLTALAPDLASLPGTAIRRELLQRSNQFVAGLTALQFPSTLASNALPPFLHALLPREQPAGAVYPTHVLALSPPVSSYTPRNAPVTVFPIHGAVFAAHSARVVLPPTVFHLRPGYLSLPVCRMTMPSVTAFVTLRAYMYTRRIDDFLDMLLPLPRSFLDELKPGRARGPRIRATQASVQKIAELTQQVMYSTPGGPEVFYALLNKVKEMWDTMCALVMCDELLWQGLDLAWSVARNAVIVIVEQYKRAAADAAPRIEAPSHGRSG
ncbi:hypothetical protein B0H11DRAFT_1740649 [Mycena galericulata]|nr:hypothetical protein B0H11DRAFT_1740649 [Mycena galericulata]